MTELRIADPLVGWQEIDEADPGDEHNDLDDKFDGPTRTTDRRGTVTRTFARGYTHVGFDTAVPLSVPAPLTVTDHLVTVVSQGRSRVEAARVHTAATPHRPVVQALLTVPQLNGFPEWWHDNGHLPYRVPDLSAQAIKGWRHIVGAQHRAGYLVTSTRDTNTHGPGPSLDPTGRTLSRPMTGIDKIVAVPSRPTSPHRLTVEVLDRRVVNLTIDGHDARGVLLRLRSPETGDAVILWEVSANIGRKGDAAKARANIALVRRGFRPGTQ